MKDDDNRLNDDTRPNELGDDTVPSGTGDSTMESPPGGTDDDPDRFDSPTIAPSAPDSPPRKPDRSRLSIQEIGDYEILSELGRGGFGVVFLAEDPKLGREVAVKVLAPQLASEPGYVERFEREAKSAARLKHPNIVSVYSTGESRGMHYMVMEKIEGRTVQELSKAGPLEEKRCIEILVDVCKGLSYAHEHGTIHRDLKPANIMVEDESKRVVIMDFGLARPEQGGNTLTQSGVALGTPVYMSPEQAKMSLGNVDRRSDLYSLGIVLYEMLTGRVPFTGKTPIEVLRKVVDDDPVPPRKLAKRMSQDLEAVILKAVEKDRDRRYQTATEFQEDLERILKGESVKAKKRTVVGRGLKWVKRNRKILAGAVALVLLVALVVGLVAQMSIKKQQEAARQAQEQSNKARKETEGKLAAMQQEQEATWSDEPIFVDDFKRTELGDRWELEGDTAGWKVTGDGLEYFGQAGGVAWIKVPVVEDFKLELQVELPEWTEEKLEQAIRMRLVNANLPLPPGDVRLSPTKDKWKDLGEYKDLSGGVTGIAVSDVAYNLATYIEIDADEDSGRFCRIHVGGSNLTSPMDGGNLLGGSATGVVRTVEAPWKDETSGLTLEGTDFRCMTGEFTFVTTREGGVVTVEVNGEKVIEGEVKIAANTRLGLGAHAGRCIAEGMPAAFGVKGWSVFSWHRFKVIRLFKKGRAALESPLVAPERLLAEGDLAGAESVFRNIMKGLDQKTLPIGHLGLAQALAEQGKAIEAIGEFNAAIQLGVSDVRRKYTVAKALRRAGGGLAWTDVFSSKEVVDAWRMALMDGEVDLTSEMEVQFSKEHADELSGCLTDASGVVRSRARKALHRLRKDVVMVAAQSLKVPVGCTAWPWTGAMEYEGDKWAKEVVHEKSGVDLVFIPAGDFMMGSPPTEGGPSGEESPQHKVTIARPFYMGRCEVTNEQYAAFVSGEGRIPAKSTAYEFCKEESLVGDDQPVACVNWNDAKAYCEWAGLRLPSEAEWEYACRAGTRTVYWFGDNAGDLGDCEWSASNSNRQTHPVGEKEANPWGIYDMHGNVFEWCEDVWHESYTGAPSDGSAWTETGESNRVNRGSCYLGLPMYCRAASRSESAADASYSYGGFRVVLGLLGG